MGWLEVISFELGEHSLLATQVVSRLRAAFRVDLRLRSLSESPTVETLAAEIEQRLKSTSSTEGLGKVLADLESLSDDEAEALLEHGMTLKVGRS